jgi:hypothetical protein
MNTGATSGGSLVTNGHYIPITVYNNVRVGRALRMTSYAVNSRTQTLINNDIGTNILPYIRPGDAIDLWEGTNDFFVNGLTSAQAYANFLTYARTVRSKGAKLMVCSIIARNWATDPPDMMTRIGEYNTLLRDNPSEYDILCDLALEPEFDQIGDTANGTYYLADELHQAVGGQNLVITRKTTSLNTLLG